MSTALLLSVLSAAALSVAVSVRGRATVRSLVAQLSRLSGAVDAVERDLAALRRRIPEDSALDQARPGGGAASQADPRVYVQLVPGQPHDRVVLSNRSSAAATDVTLDLRFGDGGSPFLAEFHDTNFPVPMLRQGVPYIVLASFRNGRRLPLSARLAWHDPDGSRRVRAFPLRF